MTIRVPGGIDWPAVQIAMREWVVKGTGLTEDQVQWGGQPAGRPAAPMITLRVENISNLGIDWADPLDNPLVLADQIAVAVTASNDLVSIPAHLFKTGDGPVLASSTGTMPANVPATVWIAVHDVNNVKLARTFRAAMANSTIDIQSAGTGTFKLATTARSLRVGEEQIQLARGVWRVLMVVECHSVEGEGTAMAQATLQRLAARRGLPSQTEILSDANVGLLDVGNVRAVGGTQSGVLYQQFAFSEVTFNLTSEDAEFGGIIETVETTDHLVSPPKTREVTLPGE